MKGSPDGGKWKSRQWIGLYPKASQTWKGEDETKTSRLKGGKARGTAQPDAGGGWAKEREVNKMKSRPPAEVTTSLLIFRAKNRRLQKEDKLGRIPP